MADPDIPALVADAEFYSESCDAADTPWHRGCAAMLRRLAAALSRLTRELAERDAEIARLRWSNDACWLVGVHGGISGIAEEMRDKARADTTVNAVIFGVAEGWHAHATALRERDEALTNAQRIAFDIANPTTPDGCVGPEWYQGALAVHDALVEAGKR